MIKFAKILRWEVNGKSFELESNDEKTLTLVNEDQRITLDLNEWMAVGEIVEYMRKKSVTTPAPLITGRIHRPSNVGQPWSDTDIKIMISQWQNGKSIQNIAGPLGRTVEGVASKLKEQGLVVSKMDAKKRTKDIQSNTQPQ